MQPTHYDTLEVARGASDSVIRAAYRALSQRYHPDKNLDNLHESNAAMQRINSAYECLSNPARRKQYDEWLNGSESQAPTENHLAQTSENRSAPKQSRKNIAQGFLTRLWFASLFALSVGMTGYGIWYLFAANDFAWKTLFVICFWIFTGHYSHSRLFRKFTESNREASTVAEQLSGTSMVGNSIAKWLGLLLLALLLLSIAAIFIG